MCAITMCVNSRTVYHHRSASLANHFQLPSPLPIRIPLLSLIRVGAPLVMRALFTSLLYALLPLTCLSMRLLLSSFLYTSLLRQCASFFHAPSRLYTPLSMLLYALPSSRSFIYSSKRPSILFSLQCASPSLRASLISLSSTRPSMCFSLLCASLHSKPPHRQEEGTFKPVLKLAEICAAVPFMIIE